MRLRDAIAALGIALGGGALLLAAVMHLAAPVIVIRPSAAIEVPVDPRPQHAASVPVRSTVARAISKQTVPRQTKRAAQARAARSVPRIVGSTVPVRSRVPIPVRSPRAAVRATLVATRAFRTRAQPAMATPTARIAIGAATKSVKTIASARRNGVAKLASRSSASAASTPQPPVGFDERPTLVEAPIAGQSTANTAAASDSGFSGLRIRGRLLATPKPEATAKAAP